MALWTGDPEVLVLPQWRSYAVTNLFRRGIKACVVRQSVSRSFQVDAPTRVAGVSERPHHEHQESLTLVHPSVSLRPGLRGGRMWPRFQRIAPTVTPRGKGRVSLCQPVSLKIRGA